LSRIVAFPTVFFCVFGKGYQAALADTLLETLPTKAMEVFC